MSQRDLAERSGVTLRAISALENGVRKAPYRDTVQRLASALRLSPDDRSRLESAAESARGGRPPTALLAAATPRPAESECAWTEADAVAALLLRHRFATLTGFGGIGKTRLAAGVVDRVLPSFADGACVVDCAECSNANDLVATIAAARRVAVRPFGSVDALAGALARQSLLLVIETCEVMPEAAGRIAGALARTAPHVAVLATSRRRLGLSNEAVHHLEPARCEGDGPACDGIPLLIEMARGSVPSDVLALAHHRADVAERHRSAIANIDWSYELLDDPQKTLLCRLPALGATFGTDDVAGALAGLDASSALATLAALVDASLVSVSEPGGTARYALLGITRAYADRKRREAGVAPSRLAIASI